MRHVLNFSGPHPGIRAPLYTQVEGVQESGQEGKKDQAEFATEKSLQVKGKERMPSRGGLESRSWRTQSFTDPLPSVWWSQPPGVAPTSKRNVHVQERTGLLRSRCRPHWGGATGCDLWSVYASVFVVDDRLTKMPSCFYSCHEETR